MSITFLLEKAYTLVAGVDHAFVCILLVDASPSRLLVLGLVNPVQQGDHKHPVAPQLHSVNTATLAPHV